MDFTGGWNEVWKSIRDQIDGRRRVIAALAYFSKADSLPWKRGDIVIADFSPYTVSLGASNPHLALDLLAKGVEFRSRGDLHAKVVWDGTRAFVGSMNSSANAHGKLLEAMVTVDDARQVSKIGRWLHKLKEKSDPLDKDALEALTAFYKPPKGGKGGGKMPRRAAGLNTQQNSKGRTWLCSSEDDDRPAPSEAKEIMREGPEEERFVGYQSYLYSYKPIRGDASIEEGDHIIFYDKVGRQTDVWPPAEVWKKKVIAGEIRIFTAIPKGDNRLTETWLDFKSRAQRCGFKKLKTMREYLVARPVADALRETWPEPKPRRRRKRRA